MRIFSATLIAILCWAELACGDPTVTVPAPEAGKHIGEAVTVEGQVVSTYRSGKGSIFLNFGAAYPNQVFTGWIPAGSSAQNSPYLDGIEGKTSKSAVEWNSTAESLKFASIRKNSCMSRIDD